MPRLRERPPAPVPSEPPAPAPPRRTAFQRYIAWRTGEGAAPTTVERMGYELAHWELFLGRAGVAPERAARPEVHEFMATWSWAPATRARTIATLRGFHAWLVDEELCDRNPWSGIRGPRLPQRLPRVLGAGEIAAMDAALAAPSVRDVRDRALLAFLAATGCRIGEAMGLRLVDVRLAERSATVLGKGSKERVVFLDGPAATALEVWLRVARPKWAGRTDKVFVGRQGEPICYSACRDALIRAARRARLTGPVRPHLLRHTFATTMLRGGADVREVQELLGHADLGSTEVYLHVDAARLRQVYDRARPSGAAAPARRPERASGDPALDAEQGSRP